MVRCGVGRGVGTKELGLSNSEGALCHSHARVNFRREGERLRVR